MAHRAVDHHRGCHRDSRKRRRDRGADSEPKRRADPDRGPAVIPGHRVLPVRSVPGQPGRRRRYRCENRAVRQQDQCRHVPRLSTRLLLHARAARDAGGHQRRVLLQDDVPHHDPRRARTV